MLAALAVLMASLPGHPSLELELAGGVAHSLDANAQAEAPLVALFPAAQARAAIQLGSHFSLGTSFLAVPGESLSKLNPYQWGTALEAVAGFASLRLHTAGETRLWIEGGAGIGHLIRLRSDDPSRYAPLGGVGAPAFRAAAGIRFRGRGIAFGGVELAWTRWTGVTRPASEGLFGKVPAASGLSTSALLLLLSVGFSLSP